MPSEHLRQAVSPPASELTGREAYFHSMNRYPVFTVEQTETALFYLRNGKRLTSLRSHPLFEKHLTQEKQALLNPKVYRGNPVRSYTQLFHDSPTIGHLVSFGNFPTIATLVRQYASVYGMYPVDYEAFMQEMLWNTLPRAAMKYLPREDGSFRGFMATILAHRLSDQVDRTACQTSMRVGKKEKSQRRGRNETNRQPIAYLSTTIEAEGESDELAELIADDNAVMPGQALITTSVLQQVYEAAQLSPGEIRILETTIVQGEDQEYAAEREGIGVRAVRYRRDQAFKKFRQLISLMGEERFKAAVRGNEEFPIASEQDPSCGQNNVKAHSTQEPFF